MSIEAARAASDDKIRCDACPVMCYIKPGAAGACDRYANHDGKLVRVDPHVVLERTVSHGGKLVPFRRGGEWNGEILHQPEIFVTAIGAGTTYPDYKPAPFIVSSEVDGVDMVTVVTEGIFSYCGVKVKIDTDRYLGPETATGARRRRGGRSCHDQRIRLADAVARRRASSDRRLEEGGPRHLRHAAGAQQRQGRSNSTIDGGANVVVQAGQPPDRQRRDRRAHARRLRLGDDRHVRQAMARQGRRGRGRRRPHHRRALGASGRQAARHRRRPASR